MYLLKKLDKTKGQAMVWTLGCVMSVMSVGAQSQSLKEAVQATKEVDPSLRSSDKNRQATQENFDLAKSRLLPQVYLQGSRQQLTQTTTQDTLLGPQSKTFSGPSVSDQLVIRQGVIRPKDVMGLDLAKAQNDHGENKYLSEVSDAAVRATTAWLELLAAQKQLELNQVFLQSSEEAAKQEKSRFARGDSTKDAMMEAQAQHENAKAIVSESLQNLSAKQLAYSLITKLPHQPMTTRKFPELNLEQIILEDREKLWQKIVMNSPDLAASKLMEKMQNVRLRQAGTDHLPTLDLVASLNKAQNDATATQGYRYQNTQVGVQYNIPIFSGGAVSAAQRQALSIYEAATADSEALLQRMEIEFVNSWATQVGLIQRILASETLRQSAIEQKKATERAMIHGLKTWADRSNAEFNLARRSIDSINTKLSLYKTQLRILRMLPYESDSWQIWINQLNELSVANFQ